MIQCRICKSNKLTELFSLGNQYLSDFRDDGNKPPRFPLDLVICDNCSQVQLKKTVPGELLYTDNYSYKSGINQTMRDHLKGIAIEAMEITKDCDNKRVIDIGSNDGTLLKCFPDSYDMTGFDLIAKFAKDYKDTGITFCNEPFGYRSMYLPTGIFTAISMFYDIDDPMTFMDCIANALDKKGIVIIQQNYLLEMLRSNAFDNIVHEHVCYYSLENMRRIAEHFDLQIFDAKVNDLNGGSIRTYMCHKGDYKVSSRVKHMLHREWDYELDHVGAYKDFANRIEDIAYELHGLLASINKRGKTCYVYGASTRGNTLLQYCGIDNILVQKAVERNPEKVGKVIASVDIPIISEEQMRREKPDVLLVLPWFFKKEFVAREAKYLEQGGKLIFPLPKVSIVKRQ